MSTAPIPKGFESLNSIVDFAGVELLNAAADDPSQQVRELLSGGKPTASDADSQLLLFVPLHNRAQVHSILVHVPEDLQAPEGAEGAQPPTRAKVWHGLPTALSFDDADSHEAPFDGSIGARVEGNWHEIKLRFVRFQNVATLLIFLDGEDPDMSTVLDHLVIVGRKGQSTEVKTLEHDDSD